MSAYVTIRGIRPADEDYEKKFAAFEACKEANCEIPGKLMDYFEGNMDPDEGGMELKLNMATEGRIDYECGGECVIDLKKLPEGVTKIKITQIME